LRPVLTEARAGTLEPRELYPVEIKALCELVAGAPLSDSPREIAPGVVAMCREDRREEHYTREVRAAYFFICRLDGGRVWQCSLFTRWIWTANNSRRIAVATALSPRNIAQGLTRCAADRGVR
jgi:hypothetical protein